MLHHNFLRVIIQFLKSVLSREFRELSRIRKLPRYTPFRTSLLGVEWAGTDGASFVASYYEIFTEEVYAFRTSNKAPYIIDCGANIGLSVLYFKRRFPSALILAFEPDPGIFAILKSNLASGNMMDIEIRNKAVWVENSTIRFLVEGGESGRIVNAENADSKKVVSVGTQSLKELLNRKVDFLKIDIEGAEYEVLQDCREQLRWVEHLFVEYHSHHTKDQKLNELLSILSDAGFRYQIKDSYTARTPFLERPLMLEMDLQLNIFAYRI